MSLNLPKVSRARVLVSGRVRHGVGHSFPQSSEHTYTTGNLMHSHKSTSRLRHALEGLARLSSDAGREAAASCVSGMRRLSPA